uniref:Uncharacterized protein n=1 Tax=Nelumbo nucifera TaxID=4432 RepID=A0A822XJS3_NELNU|nr:TPA_asm: hypothetical protein HUJ06_019291 [Nelumbo nucifera]
MTLLVDEEGSLMVIIEDEPQIEFKRELVEGQTPKDCCTAPPRKEPTILGIRTSGRRFVFNKATMLGMSKAVVIHEEVTEHHKKRLPSPANTLTHALMGQAEVSFHRCEALEKEVKEFGTKIRDLRAEVAREKAVQEYISSPACQETKDDYALLAFPKGFKVFHMLAKSLFPKGFNVPDAMLDQVGEELDFKPEGSNGDE